uniref:Ig-like domain-containing protein n=1 Tax=Loxodonta africana TaxID=9785 RepID=G3TTV3_LOXAF
SRQQRSMEPPSASPRRGGVHWQGSLLTVSLLIFWSPSIPAQPTIESVPLNAAEGNDVLLLLSNPPEDIFVYIWYKGESTGNNDRIVSYASQVQIQALGPAYTGRETIYHNGSLLIQNVTLNHSGVYTLQITTMFGPTEIAGQIRVYQRNNLLIAQVPEHLELVTSQGSAPRAILDRHMSSSLHHHGHEEVSGFKQASASSFDHNVILARLQSLANPSAFETIHMHPRLELSSDNRTLTVYSVTRNDTGSYECRTRNERSHRVIVRDFLKQASQGCCGPCQTGSFLFPPVTSQNGFLLSSVLSVTNLPFSFICFLSLTPRAIRDTQVFQQAHMFSQMRGRNNLHRGDAQESKTLNRSLENGSLELQHITVSGTGNYTCLVYNNATDFNRTTVKTITVYESVTKPSIQASSTTVTENEGPVTLTCLTNHAEISIRWIFKGQILPLTERTTLSQDNSSLTIDPIRREDTGEYQCEVYNPVSSNKSDPLNLTVTCE